MRAVTGRPSWDPRRIGERAGLPGLPENNTDADCKRADLFVTLEIDEIVEFDPPDDVGRILHDMMLLHDTHTAPETARNFEATPDRLLARTRQALANLAC